MNTRSILVEATFANPAWFSVIGLGLDVFAVAAIGWDLVVSGRPVVGAGMPRLAGEVHDAAVPGILARLRHARLTVLCVAVLVVGFLLQMYGEWPR